MACCGHNKSIKIEVVREPKGIRSTKQSRMPQAKSLLPKLVQPVLSRSMVVPKVADKATDKNCPLCGGALMAVTRTALNKVATFMQCVNQTKCNYKRKA